MAGSGRSQLKAQNTIPHQRGVAARFHRFWRYFDLTKGLATGAKSFVVPIGPDAAVDEKAAMCADDIALLQATVGHRRVRGDTLGFGLPSEVSS